MQFELTHIPISPRTRNILLAVAAGALLLLFWKAPALPKLLLSGAAVALVLSFPVRLLSRYVPRGIAIAIVVLALLALLVLAAIVLMAVKGLIDVSELRRLWRVSRFEFGIAMVAFVGVLLLGILKGVMLAAVVSLLLLVGRAARPHVAFLGRIPVKDASAAAPGTGARHRRASRLRRAWAAS